MAKKSASQIRRMQERATARGEDYTPPAPPPPEPGATDAKILQAAEQLRKNLEAIRADDNLNSKERRSEKRKAEAIATEDSGVPVADLLSVLEDKQKHKQQPTNSNNNKGKDDGKLNIAKTLKKTLDALKADEDLNSKERRAAKRKAEAVATENAGGVPAEELLSLLEKQQPAAAASKKDDNQKPVTKKRHVPYVLFVGQISFTTTKDMLFTHFQQELGAELVTEASLTIRLLTDPQKQHRSRGMAFVETDTPELLYECLRMHHTHLDGRRINVERSAGGGKQSARRTEKLAAYRKEQDDLLSSTVDKILQTYRDAGDLEPDELDDGVVSLCKRHSAATVEAALAQYVKARTDRHGGSMDNPSAYLTHMITRVSVEGPATWSDDEEEEQGGKSNNNKRGSNSKDRDGPPRTKKAKSTNDGAGPQHRFSMEGIDMSVSQKKKDGSDNNNNNAGGLSRIFPSMTRGRGRAGRGYM